MKATDENRSHDTTADNQLMVEEFRRFATFEELRRSNVYRKNEADLKRLFNVPKIYQSSEARPRLNCFLRIVEWNIERGARFEGIASALNNHPLLRYADLLLLNELDDGMVRSGNINVARELGRAISAHAIYGVEYLEMTKGTGDELNLAGENAAALHGNAILTRHHFSNPSIIRLPRCENNFESAEKRLGGRIGVVVDLDIGGMSLTAATTHLDVVNTPRCRASQMRALLQALQSQAGGRQTIVGGDLNTHTFARGGRLRTIRNTVKIFASNQDRLARSLLHPERKEAAIREFARFGYDTDTLNDREATSSSIVSNLDDAKRLPQPFKWWAMRRIGPSGLLLEFRLDWLAGRGLRVLRAGEATDEEAGETSINPQTLKDLSYDGAPLADHDPIVVDVAVTQKGE